MGDEGAKHVADMLKINQTLTSVEYAATCPISYCHHPLTVLACCCVPFSQHQLQ